jgi:non-heme chloroperoxidase
MAGRSTPTHGTVRFSSSCSTAIAASRTTAAVTPDQASARNDINGYADDLAAVIEALDLKEATLVGHSTGGGEVARYIGRDGTGRVRNASSSRQCLRSCSRRQNYKELALAFYGAHRPGAKVSQGTLDQFWLWSMQVGTKGAYESIKAFSEADFTKDLKKFDIPTLVLHGEDDLSGQDSAKKSAKLIRGAKEIYYPGAPHGLTATQQDRVNADLLAFIAA